MACSLLRFKSGFSNQCLLKFRCLSRTLNTESSLTLTEEVDGVRFITLNNPRKRNALSMDMLQSLHQDLTRNINDESLRCIVISGEGNVFSAGHDLKELRTETGTDLHRKIFAKCSEVMLSIQKLPVPVIARVSGLATAAGCQLVASCDIAIATESSKFSTPGASVGLFCSTPGVALVRAVPRKVASYMLLTGDLIDAQEALRSGLVSKVVPDDQIQQSTTEIVKSIQSKSRSVIALGKEFFYRQLNMNIESAYKEGELVMINNLALVDAQNGIKSFFEKTKPKWSHTTENVN